MWRIVKRFFVFQSKALEFRFRTWRSRRAIERAYREGSASAGLFSVIRTYARMTTIVIVVAAFCGGAYLYREKALESLTYAYKTARTAFVMHKAAKARRAAEARKKPAAVAPQVIKSDTLKATPPQPQPPPPSATPQPQPQVVNATALGHAADVALRGEMRYCILANKATKTVFLLSKDNEDGSWKAIEQFPAVMGRNEGQKQAAGDRRTPEGIYFIVGRKDKAELNPLYGTLAYVLNYPNEEDRRAGRTGQGIWIHGMPEDSSRMVTRGCIVMQNERLDTLERYLKLGVGTPVVIVDKQDLASPERFPDYNDIELRRKAVLVEYVQREKDFKEILQGWRIAWASRDIDAYSQFYDAQRFFSSGMSWNAWRDRKRSIFQAFDTIEVSVDNMRLVDCSESTAVVVFRQFYEAARQPAKQNAKRLCFFRNGARWLIYREETFSTEEFLL